VFYGCAEVAEGLRETGEWARSRKLSGQTGAITLNLSGNLKKVHTLTLIQILTISLNFAAQPFPSHDVLALRMRFQWASADGWNDIFLS
jgi:hypothetical protein